jgi:hypothetical protein
MKADMVEQQRTSVGAPCWLIVVGFFAKFFDG